MNSEAMQVIVEGGGVEWRRVVEIRVRRSGDSFAGRAVACGVFNEQVPELSPGEEYFYTVDGRCHVVKGTVVPERSQRDLDFPHGD